MTNLEKFINVMNTTFNARMTEENLNLYCTPCGMLKKHDHACKIFDCDKCEAWWQKEWRPVKMDITRPVPRKGELWLHFKGATYEIFGISTHTETGEEFVIYYRCGNPFDLYARPLEMFMSEVDRRKYPNAPQKYRFERIV